MADVNNVLVLFDLDEETRTRLESLAPRAAFRYSAHAKLDQAMVDEADVILGGVGPALLKNAKRLRWMQLGSAGSDPYQREGAFPRHALLTNATGSYGPAISEHMLAMLLALMKNLHHYRDQQAQGAWRQIDEIRSVQGETALIIGLGDIGGAFAARVKALGAYVIGVRRSGGDKPGGVDELHQPDAIDALLPRADIVALALPDTHETRRILSADRIAGMKKSAIVLNVGRGSAIDTEALCDALESGGIAGAGLDVTDPEPLPEGHRLWNMPNALITPHVSGGYRLAYTYKAIVEICLSNFRAYVEDRPLKNLVDFDRGY